MESNFLITKYETFQSTLPWVEWISNSGVTVSYFAKFSHFPTFHMAVVFIQCLIKLSILTLKCHSKVFLQSYSMFCYTECIFYNKAFVLFCSQHLEENWNYVKRVLANVG